MDVERSRTKIMLRGFGFEGKAHVGGEDSGLREQGGFPVKVTPEDSLEGKRSSSDRWGG